MKPIEQTSSTVQEHTLPLTTPFLEHVARDLYGKYGNDLSHVTIVFPNKRASLFLKEHLSQMTNQPLWCPAITTISDLFREHSRLIVADDIKLIFELWKSFVSCSGGDDSLDKFYAWGKVLLSDFDDIDKSMANAKGLFANLKDLHSYDTAEYLTAHQVEVLKHFFQDFSEDHTSILKKRFLQLWSRFSDIYTDFHQRLARQGLTYEGALYREVVDDEEADFGGNTYAFVGFNALQEVERRLFKRLRQEGKAIFYWDFDHYYLPTKPAKHPHEAGELLKNFINDFPNEFDNDSHIYDHFSEKKDITFIGAPTDSIQGRYVSQWLGDERRVKAGNRSAVVLCNEGLLPTVLHSIPDSVSDINITTGFPLMQTAAASLVKLLAELAFQGRSGRNKYRQKCVLAVLRHPYATYITPDAAGLCTKLVTSHIYYPTREDLLTDEGTRLLFRDIGVSQAKDREYNVNREVNQWMLDILRSVAMAARQNEHEEPLTHESLFRAYTLLNRLQNLFEKDDLKIDPVTYQRLIQEVVSTTTIPFHGEPAIGLQVMGVLETRNLDFDHLLVLSCNEGNMPQGIDSPSFIPQSLRKAFGLTTMDTKASIYAYYFYRLLQRATDITIMYGNAPDDKHTGEKSRFMLQLMVESPHRISRQALTTTQKPTITERYCIEKSKEVMEHLNGISTISPTAINNFIRCQLQYFYKYVAGIREPEDETEDIDNRTFGSIFHDAIQFIYDEVSGIDRSTIDEKHPFANPGVVIHPQQIDSVLKDPSMIDRNLNKAFMKHLFKTEDLNNIPEYNGLQLINRRVLTHYLKQLLTIDKKLAPFTIRGHEGDIFSTIRVTTSERTRNVRIGGRIDRLDEVDDADGRHIRVVDYKTGSKDISTTLKGVDEVFAPEKIKAHSDYYLQAMLYAMLVSRDKEVNPNGLPVSPALLFIQRSGKKDYDPVLKFDKEKIIDIRPYVDDFEKRLAEVVTHILEPNEPFQPTDDKATCLNCPYKAICGRRRQI